MIAFRQPCSGFSASDLASLEAIWPERRHEGDSHVDKFVGRRPGEPRSSLSITRHRDATYLGFDVSGALCFRGRSLADLALDGVEGWPPPPLPAATVVPVDLG